MPTNVKEEATERFLERLYLMDYLFDRVGEFPGDSRSAYEEARDVARDYFRSLCPDPPGAFNLVSPLDISYPHGRTWLRTTTPTFSWRRSIDPDPEDQVTYEISIDTTPSFTNAFVVGGITDTTYAVPDTSPLDEDTPYYWKVVAVDRTGLRRTSNPNLWSFVIDLVATGIENLPVTRWDIRSVWPNPFNPNVSVTYTAPTDGFHVVEVFDASGHRVRSLYEGSRPPGIHTVTWRGRNEAGVQVGSGVYFIRLVPPGGGSAVTRKAVLLK